MSALVRTAAQEQRGKTWSSLELDVNAVAMSEWEPSEIDEFGSSVESNILYRPQLQPLAHDDSACSPAELRGALCVLHIIFFEDLSVTELWKLFSHAKA